MPIVLSHFGPDPVATAVTRVLRRLAAGEAPRDVEERLVDVKEEAGRRSRTGAVEPGQRQNEAAAAHLAEEMACFANTEGGGAIILGISDLGKRIGTELSLEWLRHRIFELTGGMVTPAIRESEMDGVRLLVLSTAEAVEPVPLQRQDQVAGERQLRGGGCPHLAHPKHAPAGRGLVGSAIRPKLGRCRSVRGRDRPPVPPGGAISQHSPPPMSSIWPRPVSRTSSGV